MSTLCSKLQWLPMWPQEKAQDLIKTDKTPHDWDLSSPLSSFPVLPPHSSVPAKPPPIPQPHPPTIPPQDLCTGSSLCLEHSALGMRGACSRFLQVFSQMSPHQCLKWQSHACTSTPRFPPLLPCFSIAHTTF